MRKYKGKNNLLNVLIAFFQGKGQQDQTRLWGAGSAKYDE